MHWSEPLASDSFMAGKAVDSTPIILTFGFSRLDCNCHASKASAAYWHVYSVNIWKVFEKLKADRALASDDIGIVKSVNSYTLRLGNLLCRFPCIVIICSPPITFAPYDLVATLWLATFSGMTIVHAIFFIIAYATPWAWLPAEAAITP